MSKQTVSHTEPMAWTPRPFPATGTFGYQQCSAEPQMLMSQYGREMMMKVLHQPLPLTNRPPNSIPFNQYGMPYMNTQQRYLQAAGVPGFYPGCTSPPYGPFGSFCASQPQYPPFVPTKPSMMSPPRQQWPPASQQILKKRERKLIRIRDPNQGGRDITDEIMSGGRTTSTKTSPQSAGLASEGAVVQTNSENAQMQAGMVEQADEQVKSTVAESSASKSPEPEKSEPVPTLRPPSEDGPDVGGTESLCAPEVPLSLVEPSVNIDVAPSTAPTSEGTGAPPTEPALSPGPLPEAPAESPASPGEPKMEGMSPAVPESPVSTVTEPDVVPHSGDLAVSVTTDPSVPAGEGDDTPTSQRACVGETTEQDAVSVPEKKETEGVLKVLNKEATQDHLDAFKEEQVVDSSSDSELSHLTPTHTDAEEPQPAPPTAEEVSEMVKENIKPETQKQEQCQHFKPQQRKTYGREFLLSLQFVSANLHRLEYMPHISGVVLNEARRTPLQPVDPSSSTDVNSVPDFSTPYLRKPKRNKSPPSRNDVAYRSQQDQKKGSSKIISFCLNNDIQLNKAQIAWKPRMCKARGASDEDDPETARTQELFRRVRSILNKLTPEMFQQLTKQLQGLTIDTKERLQGVVDLIFDKAVTEPTYSITYARMCHSLMMIRVPAMDKPESTVLFRTLFLKRCQKEFEKDKDSDETLEKMQKELDAATVEEEKQYLKDKLDEAKHKALRRSLGTMMLIGELFKLKMLTAQIMHSCVIKLLKDNHEESLECLCLLLTTVGKELDLEMAKLRMDSYFGQLKNIIQEKKTSSRIAFMLQDVLDLRLNNWVPRRQQQAPKLIDEVHKEAFKEQMEQEIVQQPHHTRGMRRCSSYV